ncbi:MAG: hypothetical protein SF123_05885, partial [Chloroflexota bacterium]|nr:hypothetical protein [Chloroflexota bacterium]
MTLPPIGAKAVLDLTDWERNYRKVISDSAKLESAFEDVVGAANQVESALNDIRGGVDVSVNVTDEGVESVRRRIDDMQSEIISLTADVEDGELRAADQMVQDIDSATVSIPIDVSDQELTTAQAAVDDLDAETPQIKIGVDSSEVTDLLTQVRNIAAIDLAINVVGNLPGYLEQIQNLPGVNAVVDMGAAMATLEATTTRMIPNAEQLINGLYVDGWVESREEAARLVGTLANIGVASSDLGDVAVAIERTSTAMEAISGDAPAIADLTNRMQDLVSLGLADNFADAADIITAMSQSGIGISGDALGDLGEFQATFADLDSTAAQMLSTLNTGLQGGSDNMSRLSEGFISFNELLTGADEGFLEAIETLDTALPEKGLLQQYDAYKDGQITGMDFMSGVLDAARDYQPTGDQESVNAVLTKIFGSTIANLGAEAFLNVDPNAGEFSDIEGRAEAAANAVRNTLGKALEELFRMADTEFARFLSSDQIDLDGKIEYLKTRIQEVNSLLGSGMQLDQAIEIAFQIPGFSTGIDRIESILGNFVLMLSDIAASIA